MHSLGGLAGLPFNGKPAWDTFISHIAEDGHIMIMFAPHVGINSEGEIGKVRLHSHEIQSTTCGPAIDAYYLVKNNPVTTSNYIDYRTEALKILLAPHLNEIASCRNEMSALAYKMYDLQLQYLDNIINLDF